MKVIAVRAAAGAPAEKTALPPRLGASRFASGHDRRGRIVLSGNVYDDQLKLRADLGNPYPAIARVRG